MAQSLRRAIKRGRVRLIWNDTFKRMDFFKKANSGKFILCDSNGTNFISQGPGVHSKSIDKWEDNN